MTRSGFDCMQCGACCINPKGNREVGYVDYVEVTPRDVIRRRPELMRRFVVRNESDEMHMRLDAQGRCVALRGRIGRQVSCYLYEHRPAACRRVERESRGCLQARIDCEVDGTRPVEVTRR